MSCRKSLSGARAECCSCSSEHERVRVVRTVMHTSLFNVAHYVLTATEGTKRESATYRLRETRQIGGYTEHSRGAVIRRSETSFHFVKNENHTKTGAELADTFQIPGLWENDANVLKDWLDDERCDLPLVFKERVLKSVSVVVRDDDCAVYDTWLQAR